MVGIPTFLQGIVRFHRAGSFRAVPSSDPSLRPARFGPNSGRSRLYRGRNGVSCPGIKQGCLASPFPSYNYDGHITVSENAISRC